jgi:16S rRNA (cytosine1402-N4)-methyltransferase
MVKKIIKSGNVEGKTETDLFGQGKAPLKAVNRNVITASAEEVQMNPRSRSAKLRIGEKWQR